MTRLANLKFKGDRTYIQGGDFYDAVSSFLSDGEFITSMGFRTFTCKVCDIKKIADDGDLVVATIKTNCDDYLVTETLDEVVERVDYAEDQLLANAVLDDNAIEMAFDTGYSMIENVIALTKKLNYSIEPDVNGKWVFGQLKLDAVLADSCRHIKIDCTRRIEKRFSENCILIDGVNVGKIMFIVGSP